MQVFFAAMTASLVACAVTTAAIFIISRYEAQARKYAVYFMAFAAGVLISVPLLHIIPKSFHMAGEKIAPFLLLGFIGLYIVNYFLDAHQEAKPENRGQTLSLLSVLGIGFHSFIDGIIYSVTFSTDIFTGVLSALGTVLHEFPEGIIVFVLLQRGGFNRKKAILYAFLTAGVTTPAGTLISLPIVHEISRQMLSILLAVSAGALLYIGASHLLPAVEKKTKPLSIVAVGVGILVTGALIALKQQIY